MIGCIYSPLLNQSTVSALNVRKIDGEGVMAVSREHLNTFAIRPAKETSSLNEKLHTV